MNNQSIEWKKTEEMLAEMIVLYEEKVLKCAQRIVPEVTKDDLLQPNDFPKLESHPEFRYEEGVLHGIHVVQAAIRRLMLEK